MLNQRLTKYGKNKKNPILIALFKYYKSKKVNVSWSDDKLILVSFGWFYTEIASNSFPILYVCFYYRSKNLTLKITANTLDKLISKLESRYPELLFINQK